MWQLELLVVGDNITPGRLFVTLSFDGRWPDPGDGTIWDHLLVDGPYPELSRSEDVS